MQGIGIWVRVSVCLVLGLHLSVALASRTDVLCSPNRSTVIVRFTYGSEKVAWIQERTNAFNADTSKTVGGKRICVEAFAKGSGDSTREIEEMKNPAPEREIHLTSPASSLFVELTNARYGQANQGAKILLPQANLVRSPVVIAMWESVLQREFGGNASAIGWKEVMQKALSNREFRFGHTQPFQSNTGLSAIVAQFYAGALDVFGRFRSLSLEHVQDSKVQAYVAGVQSTIVQYGESTNFYADTMLRNGPTNLSAAVLYENVVIEKNKEIRSNSSYRNYPKLVAVYPKDGTFVAEHPIAFVNAPWVDSVERDAAKIYVDYLLSMPSQLAALIHGFKPGLNDIAVPEDVKRAQWNATNGVAAYDAEGTETGFRTLRPVSGEVIARILDLWRGLLKKPAQVTVVQDISTSMQGSRIEAAKKGIAEVINYLNDKDLMALMTFSNSPNYVESNPNGVPLLMNEVGKARMHREVERLSVLGGTYMYDALAKAFDDLCAAERAPNADRRIRAIIVLTDGDSASSWSLSRESFLKKVGFTGRYPRTGNCKIPIFGISYGEPDSTYTRDLRGISDATGAKTVSGSNVDEIRKVFNEMATFL